jgi:3-oxoacyl-[acyl-carrier-protein] synthase-3
MNPSAARVARIGTYVPARRASNLNRLSQFALEPDFLRQKIGVHERAIKAPDETTTDLCVQAFADLVATAGLDIGAVQLIAVVTQNPERNIPHAAAMVHARLGAARSCMTFDVSQGCAGYVHGLAVVAGLVETLGVEQALLFTADPYSTIIDPDDKATALLFGDAATVSLITRGGSGYGLVDVDFGTAPGTWECLTCVDGRFRMDGRQVFSNAAREVPQSVRRVLQRQGITTHDVDQFLLHPGSKYIVDVLRQALEVPAAKLPFAIESYGNTVSSSIPLMLRDWLRDWLRDSVRNPGSAGRVVVSGFGVGFSWGTALLEYRE